MFLLRAKQGNLPAFPLRYLVCAERQAMTPLLEAFWYGSNGKLNPFVPNAKRTLEPLHHSHQPVIAMTCLK